MRNVRFYASTVCGLLLALAAQAALAHCQIPCGIFDDAARFTEMREHVTTIDKSMKQITTLGAAENKNWNQIVRWVNNKEEHSDELSRIVTDYFMAQRIKPPKDDAGEDAKRNYAMRLTLLHRMLVEAMKAKQTTDAAHVEALRELIDAFEKAYTAK
jgi:nickel superoxide dismutase